ncbi:MAG: molybdopterin-dependent oxidoreductase [Chloroflexi bacterium]|nr:molybdopterin-dependent oxidoreductase [Chloroflexota bacterium]
MMGRGSRNTMVQAERTQEAPRIDSWGKVSGSATFVEDMPELTGSLYAAPVKSPYAHARVGAIDVSRALALEGVSSVLYRDNLHEFGLQLDALAPLDPALIVGDKALYQGDLVAVVVASDLRTARRAAELVDVDYEILDPVFSAEAALQAGAPILHDHRGTNSIFDDSLMWGDIEDGFRQAVTIVERNLVSPTVFHHPMEPVGTGMVRFAGDIAEIWAPTNTPMRDASDIAHVLGVPADHVHLRVPYVGGGFGAKKTTREMAAALALSRKLRRPIRVVATGEESFHVAVRHAMEYRARVGVDAEGRLVALDVDLAVDCGAYFTGGKVATHNACTSAWGPYRVPHFRVRAKTAFTNKTPATPHRGTGKTQTTFAIECLMDEVARTISTDPVEFRERNVLLPGERVPERFTVEGSRIAGDSAPMTIDFPSLMREGMDALGPEQPPLSPSLVRGRGVSVSLRNWAKGSEESQASATLNPDGTVTVAHTASDLGQGIYNMISVVAAKTLGLDQAQIHVENPDTSTMLRFPGATAQRTTIELGNAVYAASTNLKRQIIDLAVESRGGTPDAWIIQGGSLWLGDVRYSLSDLAKEAPGVVLSAVGSDTEVYPTDDAFGETEFWTPGVAAAEVDVDRDTGEISVLRYAILAEAGKILHYNSARGQLEGGAVMGFGLALFEELRYEDGQVQNADAFQYRLPLMRDVPPSFQVLITENGDGPGPFGAKGIAQTSIPCVAPAVANAIFDAVGVPVSSTPITPEKVLRALGTLTDRP